jgi:hypothetical protein
MQEQRTFIRGVYRFRPGDPPVIYFDGEHWLLPGWEVPMTLGDRRDSFHVTPDDVGDLLWSESQADPDVAPVPLDVDRVAVGGDYYYAIRAESDQA